MNSGRRIRRKRGSPIAQNPTAVRKARELAELQQRELADAIGISRQLMCDIEAGRRSATPPILRLIAERTGADVSHLERVTQHTCSACGAAESA